MLNIKSVYIYFVAIKIYLSKFLKDIYFQSNFYQNITHLLNIRRKQKAFHPNAARYNLNFGSKIFAFKRVSLDKKQSIICITNLSSKIQNITLNKTYLRWKNLIKLHSKLNKQ